MPDGQNSDQRHGLRANVFLTAVLRHDNTSGAVRIRNISAIGAMIEGEKLPAKGSAVRLERGSLGAGGVIVREVANARGIRFDAPVEVNEWVKRSGNVGQRQVDSAVAAVRSGSALDGGAEVRRRRSVHELLAKLQHVCERMTNLPDLSIEVGESLVEIEAIRAELVSAVARLVH
jgi:hypothetical protein